jgi:hypothetical protein
MWYEKRSSLKPLEISNRLKGFLGQARSSTFPFSPVADPRGFGGMVALLLEMASRCDDGNFTSTFIDAIGAGRIVTTINEVNANRNGRSITYNTMWTFRCADGVVAEAWLHPSLPGHEIARFYGFSEA